jgi:hypothetical protein
MKSSLNHSYRRVLWRPLKNPDRNLVIQRLHYIDFIEKAHDQRLEVIQIDEFNVNRHTLPAWHGLKIGTIVRYSMH